MKLPKVTKALGSAVLVGVATSASAANLTLGPGGGGSMPADVSGGLPLSEIVAWTTTTFNQAGSAVGEFRARVDSVITQRPDSTLAFWYKLTNYDQRTVKTEPIRFLGIRFQLPTSTVTLNQESDALATTAAADFATYDGTSVAFSYGLDPIDPGTASQWTVIYTTLTDDVNVLGWEDKYFGRTTVEATANNSRVFWGFSPIPEPATYAGMFAFGLAGFAAYRRFRA